MSLTLLKDVILNCSLGEHVICHLRVLFNLSFTDCLQKYPGMEFS